MAGAQATTATAGRGGNGPTVRQRGGRVFCRRQGVGGAPPPPAAVPPYRRHVLRRRHHLVQFVAARETCSGIARRTRGAWGGRLGRGGRYRARAWVWRSACCPARVPPESTREKSRKAAVPDDWTDCGCAAQKPLARGAVATAGPAWCLNGRAHFLIDDRDQCRTHGWCDSQRGGVIGETRRWARHSKQQCSQRVTLTLFCTRTHRGSAAAPNVVLTGIWTGADAPVLCLITSWTTGPPFGAYPQKPSECPFLALCVRLAHGIAKYSLLWSSE